MKLSVLRRDALIEVEIVDPSSLEVITSGEVAVSPPTDPHLHVATLRPKIPLVAGVYVLRDLHDQAWTVRVPDTKRSPFRFGWRAHVSSVEPAPKEWRTT